MNEVIRDKNRPKFPFHLMNLLEVNTREEEWIVQRVCLPCCRSFQSGMGDEPLIETRRGEFSMMSKGQYGEDDKAKDDSRDGDDGDLSEEG